MKLDALIEGLAGAKVRGDAAATEVRGVRIDSRKVAAGDLFVALAGARQDGRAFVDEAVRRGAVAVAVTGSAAPRLAVPAVALPDARALAGELAARAHGHPTRGLRVIGVTGTNGKTTTAFLIERVLTGSGVPCGYVGTLDYRWGDKIARADRTTPEATDLQEMFAAMKSDGVAAAAIECSSHGIEMGRLAGVAFDVAVFTNLTQDHLDYHRTMEEYAAAKKKLFAGLLAASPKPGKKAVFNLDDPIGRRWFDEGFADAVGYSTAGAAGATVTARGVAHGPDGIRAKLAIGGAAVDLVSPLMGDFNLSNILAAAAAAHAVGVPAASIAAGLAGVAAVPGRLERVSDRPAVVVDYAHTDDAFQKLLSTLRPLCRGKLIHVFGCGGDRDRTKRPKMMRVACEFDDAIVLTSDNPRGEDPRAIMADVLGGRAGERVRIVECVDRRQAIGEALRIAGPEDTVVITGKGHEDYQEIAGRRYPFDDRAVARELLGGAR